jgi:hypothetical protein
VSRLMSLVWTVQFFVLMAASVVSLAKPEWMIYLLEDCRVTAQAEMCCPVLERTPVGDGEAELRATGACHGQSGLCGAEAPPGAATAPCAAPCAHTCSLLEGSPELLGLYSLTRMIAPFYLVFALFSAHAAMRTDERTRRNLAFIFAGIFMMFGALVYTDGFDDRGVSKPVFLFGALIAVLAALVLFSLYSMVRAEDGARRSAAVLAALGYGALLVGGVVVYRKLLVHVGGSAEMLSSHRAVHAAGDAYRNLYLVHDWLPWATLIAVLVDTVAGDLERTRARIYAVTLISPLILLAFDLIGKNVVMFVGSDALSDEPVVVKVLLGLIALNVVLHAQYAAWPIEDAEQKLSGSANTRPSALWVLWLFQGLVFCGFAVFLLWTHDRGGSVFVSAKLAALLGAPSSGYRHLYDSLDQLYPGLFAAIGLFSFAGMHTSREWVWKAHCFIYAVFYGATMLCLLFVWDPGTFSRGFMLLLLPAALLFAAHLAFHRSHEEWFSEDVGEGPDGWILADLCLGPLLIVRSLITRRRASHARGVAAEGRMITMPPSAALPEHEFFHPCAGSPGDPCRPDVDLTDDDDSLAELPPPSALPAALRQTKIRVQIRFANERSTDDAGADARGAALCMVTPDGKRFDLTLSTGAYSAAQNVAEFAVVQLLTAGGALGRRLLARSRRFLEGGLAALRRAPTSYAHLWYHSQTVRFWVSTDGRRNLVRYRLSPDVSVIEDDESGLPVTPEDYAQRGRRSGDRRPADYLRRELKMRLQGKTPVRLKLQAQLHEIQPGDGIAWYNPAADWNEKEHPWQDLGEITLDAVLSDEVAEKLTFSTDRVPSSLGIPVSQGIFDPRSIADSERRVMKRVQALRTWMIGVLGLPRSPLDPVS